VTSPGQQQKSPGGEFFTFIVALAHVLNNQNLTDFSFINVDDATFQQNFIFISAKAKAHA
jgi:hypothetical protein